MTELRIHALSSGTTSQRLFVHNLSSASLTQGQRLLVHELSSQHFQAVTSTIAVNAGADIVYPAGLEPFDTGTLTATSADSPDTYEWLQISGPVALITTSADSATCSYEVPADRGLNGADLVFQVTITKAGAIPASDTVTHHVYPHTVWGKDATGNPIPLIVI